MVTPMYEWHGVYEWPGPVPTGTWREPNYCILLLVWLDSVDEQTVGSDATSYLTESVHKVALQKSIPSQIRQDILHISNNKGRVHGFVREMTLAKQLYKHFLRDKVGWGPTGT